MKIPMTNTGARRQINFFVPRLIVVTAITMGMSGATMTQAQAQDNTDPLTQLGLTPQTTQEATNALAELGLDPADRQELQQQIASILPPSGSPVMTAAQCNTACRALFPGRSRLQVAGYLLCMAACIAEDFINPAN